jgi:hypothetical protein
MKRKLQLLLITCGTPRRHSWSINSRRSGLSGYSICPCLAK